MKRFVEGEDRRQATLLPDSLEDYVTEDNPVRVVDVFIDELDLEALGFSGVVPEMTYRIAGGEAGMRHFLAQFGPCLKWPWTKLTDVVDLDEALIEKIAAQSDKQAAGLSIRELERIRDENLVGILQSLKTGHGGEGWGAGKLLAEFERRLLALRPPAAPV